MSSVDLVEQGVEVLSQDRHRAHRTASVRLTRELERRELVACLSRRRVFSDAIDLVVEEGRRCRDAPAPHLGFDRDPVDLLSAIGCGGGDHIEICPLLREIRSQ